MAVVLCLEIWMLKIVRLRLGVLMKKYLMLFFRPLPIPCQAHTVYHRLGRLSPRSGK